MNGFSVAYGRMRCSKPKLEQSLIDKLVVLADFRHRFQVGSAATTTVLNIYELDMEAPTLILLPTSSGVFLGCCAVYTDGIQIKIILALAVN